MAVTNDKTRLIVVVGMHRSGTSVFTRSLLTMGVDIGSNLMEPIQNNNEKGFFEDKDINKLNIDMMNAIEHKWYQLSPVRKSDIGFLNEKGFAEQAEQLLTEKIKDRHIFAFKDPRMAKLLPFWQRVFERLGCNVDYVLPIRAPNAVVSSLQKRDSLPISMGYWLWFGHLATALSSLLGQRFIVCDYDRLLGNPLSEMHRVAQFLSLTLEPSMLEEFTSSFLEERLRHFKPYTYALKNEKSCPFLVADMFEMLTVLSNQNQFDRPLVNGLLVQGWFNYYLENYELFFLIDTHFFSAASNILEVKRLHTENERIEQLEQALFEKDKMIAELQRTALQVKND